MITRLRRKFCLINILSAFFISLILFTVIYVTFYKSYEDFASNTMKKELKNVQLQLDAKKIRGNIDKKSTMLEFPVEFNGFKINMTACGEILSNEHNIDLTQDNIFEIIRNKKLKYITIQNKSYRILRNYENNSIKSIFYDRTEEIRYFFNFFILLILLELIFLVFFSIFSYFISRWIIGPVKESFKRQREFIANASHELKTPITIISANLDLISYDNELTQEQKKSFDKLKKQTNYMRDLLKSLLSIARLEEKGKYSKKDLPQIEISVIIKNILLSFGEVASENKKDLSIEHIETVFIKIFKEDFERLCYILIDNAIKYSNKQIHISLYPYKKKYMLKITNTYNGKVFDENRIFERFYKGSENSSSFGLGLSMAKEICDKYRIKIKCEKTENEVSFYLIL